MPISVVPKNPYEDDKITDLAKKYNLYRKKKKALKKYLKELNKAGRWLELKIIERLEALEADSISIKGVANLSAKDKFYCNVDAKNREAAADFLKENGHDEIFSLRPDARKLPATVKLLLQSPHIVVPKDIFKYGEKKQLYFTRRK